MRTDAEKHAFAMECLRIEEKGGDVLGYIEVNWPSYTPRATWYNLQRQYLNRATYQLTEGKLKASGKEKTEMRRDRETMLKGVLKVLGEKGDPIEWLKSQGYANPHQAWTDLRAWANRLGKNQGRLPANLSTYYANLRRQEASNEPAPVDLGEHPEQVKEAVNRVFFGGKEYEKMDEPSPTCCQPAKPSGVTVPDVLPLKIAALISDIDQDYRYERTRIQKDKHAIMRLIWREPMGGGERYLAFTAEEWKRFAKEIPQALEQLGL